MAIDLATLGTDGFVIYGVDVGDASGASVSSAGDINGDGFDDLIIGAPFADGPGVAPGTRNYAGDTYVVFGTGAGFPAAIDLVNVAAGIGGFVIHGADAEDYSGQSVSSAGDINGDGFDDLIIGARYADGPGAAPGTRNLAGDSYVVFGHAGAFAPAIDLVNVAAGISGFVIHGADAEDYSGQSVSSAGDINGDGFDDLVIGASRADGPGAAPGTRYDAGGSYVVFGKAGGFGAAIDLANVAAGIGGFVIHGVDALDRSGRSVSSAGDINGDGFDDLIIGANGADGPGAAPGTRDLAGDSYMVFGSGTGFPAAIDLANVAAGIGGFVIHGADVNDQSGALVSSAGDVNGDGFHDLIIGARFADGPANTRSQAGDSYVLFGHAGAFAPAIDLGNVAAGSGGFVIYGADAGDQSGFSVSSAGDVNGDGFDDILIGARNADGPGAAPGTRDRAGDCYVVFGKTGGFGASVDLVEVTAGIGGFVINGAEAGDYSGVSVACAGDVDGDGFDDLIIGAYGGDGPGPAPGTRDGAGDSYVLFGSATVGGSVDHVTSIGGAGAQILVGSAAADDMVGGRDNDTLLGGGGIDVLIGGQGNDVLSIGDATFRRVNGGTGHDVLAFSGAITLADSHFRKVSEVESLRLGNGAISLTMGAIAARAIDGNGNSLIAIDGTAHTSGAVTINASALLRPLSLTMGSANDSITILGGTVAVNGGGGIDTVKSSISFVLGVNTERLTLLGGATINGTGNSLANIITGNGTANILNGGSGNDLLDGRGGNDRLIGGAGNDTFVINSTGDRLTETSGIDLVRSTVTKTLATGFEKLTLLGALNINGTGNAAANAIVGNAGNNKLSGAGGNDVMNGGSRNDTLNGGAGNDILVGGSGNDRLIGGLGKDTMTGNAGADDFDFNSVAEIGRGAGRSFIRDFTHLIDDIDLATIDANGGAAGNAAFSFLAAKGAAFTGVAGQLHWFQVNAPGTANDRTIIEGDTNGNKIADFQIQLTGLKTLTAADFVL